MSNHSRRCFFSFLGIGSVLSASSHARAVCTPMGARMRLPETPPRADLRKIAEKLIACTREEAFPTAVGCLRDGATWSDLLGGAFLAGVKDIKPQPVGFQFHAVMMVESAFQLAEATTAEQRLLPVFFNIDDFKRGQARDRQRGDWVQKRRADKATMRPQKAREEFAAALRERDEERADRAITSLYAASLRDKNGMDDLFEILWPHGGADYYNIGHKIIYTAHAYRTLKRIGWEYGLPVLRSLVLGILDGPGKGASIEPYAVNAKLAAGLKDSWATGKTSPKASHELLTGLRNASVPDAAPQAVAMLGRGIAPASIWDGYRLVAAEMLIRRPGILPVHPTTAINAMHFAWLTTQRDATKRLLLLQGASWLALYRDTFRRSGMRTEDPVIDELKAADEPPAAVDAIFSARSRTESARLLLASSTEDRPAIEAELRRHLFAKGTEHHAYKYTAAVIEESRHAHPEIAPKLLAASVHYLPNKNSRDAAVYLRAKAALLKLKQE